MDPPRARRTRGSAGGSVTPTPCSGLTASAAAPPPVVLDEPLAPTATASLLAAESAMDILTAPLTTTLGPSSNNMSTRRGHDALVSPSTPTAGRAKRMRPNVKYSPVKTGKVPSLRLGTVASTSGSSLIRGVSHLDVVNPSGEYCDVCGTGGLYICCDGCPLIFHPLCADPPLMGVEEAGDHWFCGKCSMAKNPSTQPESGLFSQLNTQLDQANPQVFKLPRSIRQQYEYISVDPLTGDYVDEALLKKPKLDAKGYAEEPDPFRTKTKDNRSILCFMCGLAASTAKKKRILSCDSCEQHFHYDCLDPPMTVPPPSTLKWTCPLHAEQALPRSRHSRQTTIVKVTRPSVLNNGDIEVIPRFEEKKPPRGFEEIMTNRLRYQVPEEILVLDFWSKLKGERQVTGNANLERLRIPVSRSGSSPLTSLDSLESSPSPLLGRDLPPLSATPSVAPSSAGDIPRRKPTPLPASTLGMNLEPSRSSMASSPLDTAPQQVAELVQPIPIVTSRASTCFPFPPTLPATKSKAKAKSKPNVVPTDPPRRRGRPRGSGKKRNIIVPVETEALKIIEPVASSSSGFTLLDFAETALGFAEADPASQHLDHQSSQPSQPSTSNSQVISSPGPRRIRIKGTKYLDKPTPLSKILAVSPATSTTSTVPLSIAPLDNSLKGKSKSNTNGNKDEDHHSTVTVSDSASKVQSKATNGISSDDSHSTLAVPETTLKGKSRTTRRTVHEEQPTTIHVPPKLSNITSTVESPFPPLDRVNCSVTSTVC